MYQQLYNRPPSAPYAHPYGHAPAMYPTPSAYVGLPPVSTSMSDYHPRRMSISQISIASSSNIKRLAPQAPHPNESPAKKKQSKWSAEEDAAIIELRGNGMKWEDISKNLPGRSAISCRLRFQNYLERRSEWDEEKKNKLARLYESCGQELKADIQERHVGKNRQRDGSPWRAAEAMHWQIGEVEMANRANVPVFHLAGQQQTSQPSQSQQQPPLHPLSNPVSSASTVAPDTRSNSTSPQSATTAWPPPPTTYPHTHSHTLPQLSQHQQGQPASPPSGRNSNESAHSSSVMREGRDRADSARSVTAAMHRAYLPPLGDGIGRGASSQQSSGYVSPFAPQTEKR
ncbi:hypothetical protein H2203_006665 [Taxawa tesnikishii (nom. ined.)]|nr:hypothetical protein H2203_006665 [Dothideales sp. JES 119]